MFYPSTSVAPKGDPILFCYGVENAVSVRIEPPIEQITPSFNRCFQYTPKESREYRLVATGADGTTVSQKFGVSIGAPSPKSSPAQSINPSFTANRKTIRAGEVVTLCYGADGAESVSLNPSVDFPLPTHGGCFSVTPSRTTTYTLKVRAASGTYDRTVKVEVQ